jgi:hypothetical protein
MNLIMNSDMFYTARHEVIDLSTGNTSGSTVVKVLRYKPEGRWFDPRWCHGIFH